MQAIFYECGICDHLHPWDWNGDCRDDANRLTINTLEDRYGENNFEIRSMDKRLAADAQCELSSEDAAYNDLVNVYKKALDSSCDRKHQKFNGDGGQ